MIVPDRIASNIEFQSTLRARGATCAPVTTERRRSGFNPRSRAGSDTLRWHEVQADHSFQSTLPRGERLWRRMECAAFWWFQSTLPRGERLGPTVMVEPEGSSIHAPARGATISRGGGMLSNTGFNPRSRAGSDSALAMHTTARVAVSIHAPARGAT